VKWAHYFYGKYSLVAIVYVDISSQLIFAIFMCVGWPKLQWFITENLSRPTPKDWQPPTNQDRSSAAYIEVKS